MSRLSSLVGNAGDVSLVESIAHGISAQYFGPSCVMSWRQRDFRCILSKASFFVFRIVGLCSAHCGRKAKKNSSNVPPPCLPKLWRVPPASHGVNTLLVVMLVALDLLPPLLSSPSSSPSSPSPSSSTATTSVVAVGRASHGRSRNSMASPPKETL